MKELGDEFSLFFLFFQFEELSALQLVEERAIIQAINYLSPTTWLLHWEQSGVDAV